jgi:hypothetical protein
MACNHGDLTMIAKPSYPLLPSGLDRSRVTRSFASITVKTYVVIEWGRAHPAFRWPGAVATAWNAGSE